MIDLDAYARMRVWGGLTMAEAYARAGSMAADKNLAPLARTYERKPEVRAALEREREARREAISDDWASVDVEVQRVLLQLLRDDSDPALQLKAAQQAAKIAGMEAPTRVESVQVRITAEQREFYRDLLESGGVRGGALTLLQERINGDTTPRRIPAEVVTDVDRPGEPDA